VPSLLAVFAHPDDESLSAGGLLARHAAAGARTAVVTATWAPDTPRARELAEALRILGADEPRMLGYADARAPESAPGHPCFCDAPLDEAVRRLVAHIREFRPEIMVTHDAYGGLTGHPDHVQTHRVTMLAGEAAGLEQLYQDAGPPWQPRALYLATHPHSTLPTLRDVIGARKAVYTVPDEEVTTILDVTPWLERSSPQSWLIAPR
jgi:N-acetyl-1-D-myo-inositol-2-amino-2-deoxy-alpha-D-glucopyranoside deacetylase